MPMLQVLMLSDRKMSESEDQELTEFLDGLPASLEQESKDIGDDLPVRPFFRFIQLRTNNSAYIMRGFCVTVPNQPVIIQSSLPIVEIPSDRIGEVEELVRELFPELERISDHVFYQSPASDSVTPHSTTESTDL